jgi:hypothetical protein
MGKDNFTLSYKHVLYVAPVIQSTALSTVRISKSCNFVPLSLTFYKEHKTKLRSISPQANYTDWATAAVGEVVPTFADRGVLRGQRNGSPRPLTIKNISMIKHSPSIMEQNQHAFCRNVTWLLCQMEADFLTAVTAVDVSSTMQQLHPMLQQSHILLHFWNHTFRLRYVQLMAKLHRSEHNMVFYYHTLWLLVWCHQNPPL